MVVAATVIITDSKADGPSPIDWPTCHRVAVLKNFPCSPKSERKMCGGGRSWGSAQPIAHNSSQMPANRLTERTVHQALPSQSHPPIEARKRLGAGRDAPVAGVLALRSMTVIAPLRSA